MCVWRGGGGGREREREKERERERESVTNSCQSVDHFHGVK